MDKVRKLIPLVMAMTLLLCSCAAPNGSAVESENGQIKNIIVMIPDGMSAGGVALARWYKSYDDTTGEIDTRVRLTLDELASGMVRTYWQTPYITGAITDSAPAASAFATGHKTDDKRISVSWDKLSRPLSTILEAAKSVGKATGIVATANIQHATPAAFSSHYPDRSRYDILGEQQVYQGMDVVLGGGSVVLYPPYRLDGEDLAAELIDMGYQYVETRDEMNAVTKGKLWGMFAEEVLAYDMDRQALAVFENEPSLAEMTRKAIELLSQDEDGFFLFVEGSQVDWASHASDPVGVVSEILAFDEAVGIALEFAKQSGDTMVLIMADHGNGGITIGRSDISVPYTADDNNPYSKDPVQRYIEPIKQASLTGAGLEFVLDEDGGNILEVMAEYYGITDLTEDEIALLMDPIGNINETAGPMISVRARIGWTTTGHTGEDVTLYTYLPGNGRITGLIENTDIAEICANALGVDLNSLTESLFINANEAFAEIGAEVIIDDTDEYNPLLVVSKDGVTVYIPESKNYVFVNDERFDIPSVIVNINGIFYVPVEVVGLIK